MSPAFLFLLALGLGLAGWLAGRAKARAFTRGSEPRRVLARPGYHAWFVAIWVIVCGPYGASSNEISWGCRL